MISVEVMYATPVRQVSIPVSAEEPMTIQQAIQRSSIMDQFPELSLQSLVVGIWGKTQSLETLLNEGDRVEIYRPLAISPIEARSQRAIAERKRRGGKK